MIDPFWSQVMVAVPATLFAAAAFVQAWMNYRNTRNLRKSIDGRMDELKGEIAVRNRAEGQLDVLKSLAKGEEPPPPDQKVLPP